MAKLKSRQKQIPNGLRFFVPQTKWRPPQYASFETIVRSLQAHLVANPNVAAQNRWPVDYNGLCDLVDRYNAQICKDHGWKDYYIDDGIDAAAQKQTTAAAPQVKKNARENVAGAIRRVSEGAAVIIEWLKSGEEAVPKELSEKRAKTCVSCPKNGTGDWTHYFTVPVAKAIREELNKRKSMNLSTSVDDKLKVCTGCMCPIPLKVHIGINQIISRMNEETKSKLDNGCWILEEKRLLEVSQKLDERDETIRQLEDIKL
jgi:hypothetical protein